MKNKCKKIILFLFAVVLSFSSVDVCCALETEVTKTVRVGLYEMDGFQYHDEYGGISGYNIDYLNLLSTVTGWEYEYVPVSDFQDGCTKLLDKEIDLIAPAMWTESRDKLFTYSENSFGVEYTVLVTQKDNTQLFCEDFENYNNLDVAVVRDYPLTEYFIQYMDEKDFKANLIYYDTVEAARSALAEKEVEALVTSIMDMNDEQKLLARFAPQNFYYITWQGNDDFLNSLNEAMERIETTYPEFLDELLIKHYPIYSVEFLTKEEQEYVNRKQSIRVAYIDGRPPLSFTNEDGELDGISRKVFDRISEITGLQFEYTPLPGGSITYDYFLDNGIELITGVEYNTVNINSSGILLSSSYLSSKKIMVSKKDFVFQQGKKYKIAVVSGSLTLRKVLSGKYPQMEIVDFDSIEECFDALYHDEVDLLIQNQYVVDSVMANPRYKDFVVVPVEGLDDKLCFSTVVSLHGKEAMSEAESLLVISILNKAISQISNTEMDTIIVSETLSHQYEITMADFLYSYRFTVTAVLFAVLLAMTFFIYAYNINKKERRAKEKEVKQMLLQQRRYQTVMDCSEDMIYEISLAGESNIGSDRIKEKFGWEIPRQVDDLDFSKTMKILHVHPDDEPNFRKTILNTGSGMTDELRVRMGKADGTYIWCRVTRMLLLDDEGNLVSVLGKITDIDEEVKEREKLELKSRTDPLTGLLNKVAFKKATEQYLKQGEAKGAAFLFVDMDHYKDINDKLGHETGDAVIKDTAKKIQLLFANFDLVSRFGGDEFCVFVKDIPRETFVDKLQFANKKLKEVYSSGDASVTLSASIGAVYCQKDVVTYDELFNMADEAVYQAKDNGRNCFVIRDLK